MKKTLLASAILASLVSVSAQAATVYDADGQTLKISGDVDAVAYFDSETEDNDAFDGTAQADNYASINAKGTTVVSDTVTAYAEFEIDTDGSDFAVDELNLGLDTAYGDFSFGDTTSALSQISDFTDVGNNFAGNIEAVGGDGATGFAYANTFSGLTVNAEFKAAADEANFNNEKQNGDSLGLSAVYSMDGFSVGLGYVSLEDSNELALGLSYSIDALYVGLGYAMGTDVSVDDTTLTGTEYDFTAIELAVTYGVTDDVTVMAFYGTGEVEVGSFSADNLDYYALEVEYTIASNVSAYVGYGVNNLDSYSDEPDDSDTSIYTQISYDF